MNAIVSRRSFITASLSAAGGLVVAVALPGAGAALPAPAPPCRLAPSLGGRKT